MGSLSIAWNHARKIERVKDYIKTGSRFLKGAFRVVIGQIYCKKIISVPMSYIIVQYSDISIYNYNYNQNFGAGHNYNYNFGADDNDHHHHHHGCGRPKGRIVSLYWTKSKFNNHKSQIIKDVKNVPTSQLKQRHINLRQ